ncbi:esterase [Nocardia donostiensis]|uniref:Esterase n=1 Tax=Nocardia donostiensis TaxID=1538463 RepID=A0A1V2T938_9NOCA|nr:alpha/beta hydrolase-fold protein [Nocardia donostiensis]ONM46023.1 esterase [Nocardia donostiensis]OQS18485.1 esterase [Nocardia donostiensis]
MGLATALVLPLAAGLAPAQTPATAQPAATAAAAATLRDVVWLTDRQVQLWVNSPAMGAPIQVRLLLAKDWNTRPDARFPVLYMLDGLRANEQTSGWLEDAGAADFFADKNVTVVLPVGGQSSFYSDWLKPDNGKNYQWETFLTEELPSLLESQWRATNVRGMEGLSMGGTAAMFLAARNPDFVRYAASYSGFLTTTTLGMPQAIQFAMRDAGGFDSTAMWGPPTHPAWKAHDPYLLADKLKDVSLYISSGSGTTGTYDQPTSIPGVSTNLAGMGLEILSRLTSQNFVTKLRELSIPAQVNYRAAGTHSWPYWDFEMRQSWPQAAAALGVPAQEAPCESGGAIGALAATNGWLGGCLTGEYQVDGGVAQDFRGGRVFFSPQTGTHAVGGMIGGGYQAAGGPAGVLGLPTGGEQPLPDGRGHFQPFQHGALYWTPQTGAQVVRGAILDEWGRQGFERGPAGYPVGPEVATPNREGAVQSFEGGPFYFSPGTGVHRVQGLILGKYAEMGFENSWLGFPATDEQPLKDLGCYSGFEGGNIYWSPLSGAWAVRNGPIMDAWRDAGYENGRLGYPISDEFAIPGGVQQNFQAGFITVRDNHTEVHAAL